MCKHAYLSTIFGANIVCRVDINAYFYNGFGQFLLFKHILSFFFLRWQSENALHNVTLTLNLETQFQFISTILRFKTFRPAAMYLERSVDFAQTWQPYAYFSNNCPRDFPSIPERPRRSLRDVTCTNIYSQLTPSEGGVVSVAVPSHYS